MKKIFISAAIVLFTITAFSQSNSNHNANSNSKEIKDKENDDAIDNSGKKENLDKNVKLTREEKAARKAERKAAKAIRKADRKADRQDDGIINESTMTKNSHGKDVSQTAKETTLEGREKGEAISNVARSKARNEEKAKHNANRPAKTHKSKAGKSGR